MSKTIAGYKGTDADGKCRGFQYESGKEYETEEAVCCESGFHFCEEPFDVFGYYPPSDSRYYEVEGGGDTDKDGNDSKVACSKIKIGAEIGLPGIIKAGVSFILERAKKDTKVESNTGYQSAATNTGNRSAATNTGYQSAATNTGNWSAATNTGNRSAATNTGDWSAATNTGNRSAATNTGDQSAATVSGTGSIAIATGYDSMAKGALGCAIVVAERAEWNGETYPLINIKSAIVDGKIVKANTFYALRGGEFVEVEG